MTSKTRFAPKYSCEIGQGFKSVCASFLSISIESSSLNSSCLKEKKNIARIRAEGQKNI